MSFDFEGEPGVMVADRDAYFQSAATQLPRWLFRGFNGMSGGGEIAGLNTKDAIVPRDFLTPSASPLPDSIENLTWDELLEHRRHHLGGSKRSAFSSWSANFESALWFALGRPGTGPGSWFFHAEDAAYDPVCIAVLDTSTIPKLQHRVFHAPTLGRDWPVEYVVWGPVRRADGADVRVVELADIRRAVGCRYWPRCMARQRMPHPLREQDIREAAQVANLFRLRPGDRGEEQDMPVAVFAAELSRQQWPTRMPACERDEAEEAALIRWRVPDRATMRWYVPRHISTKLSTDKPLVNPFAHFKGFLQTRLMMDILQAHRQLLTGPNRGPREAGEMMRNLITNEPDITTDALLRRTLFPVPDWGTFSIAAETIRTLFTQEYGPDMPRPDITTNVITSLLRAADSPATASNVHDCGEGNRAWKFSRQFLEEQYDDMTNNTSADRRAEVLYQPRGSPVVGSFSRNFDF